MLNFKTLNLDKFKCVYCPLHEGALKHVFYNNKTKIWAHSFCINWIPEIYFTSEKEK